MSVSGKTRFELIEPRSSEALISDCRAAGLRMGSKRRAVARALAEAEGPFDFDSLWARTRRIAPGVSRGTIYLSLRRFRLAGLLRTRLAGAVMPAEQHRA